MLKYYLLSRHTFALQLESMCYCRTDDFQLTSTMSLLKMVIEMSCGADSLTDSSTDSSQGLA